MHFLVFREPVSAWSHCSWLLLSLPGTVWLWRRSGGDVGKQLSLLVFGLSLSFCYAGSTLYHGVRISPQGIAVCNLVDYIGIYVLIAGSYTPVAWNLLRGRWRSATIVAAWGFAAAGIAVQVAFRVLPSWVPTVIYLAMGWGALACYLEIASRLSYRPLRALLLGGVLYTVGAVINLAGWPVLWPGVFGSHELFHLFAMGGSLSHFWFMMSVVVPSVTERACPKPNVPCPVYVQLLAPGRVGG